MARVGRNDRCPCGSGRKYKHCCLHQAEALSSTRSKLREAEAELVPAVFAYALERYGKDFLAAAWQEHFQWAEGEELPDNLPDDPDFQPLFLPWFLFSYVADPHEESVPEDAPDEPLARAYLDEHDQVGLLERQLAESACRGGFSFHVVQSVGQNTIALHDILTGADLVVLEQSGGDSLTTGDIVFAFPVAAGGAAILLGCAPLVIPATWHNTIIDFREDTWAAGRPGPEDLIEYDFEIRDLYFEIADAIYNPRPPELTNTDGEALQLMTLTYDLRCSVDEAWEVLKRLAGADAEAAEAEGDEAVERNEAGQVVSATLRWLNDKDMLLARVEIAEGIVRVHVNSSERAARVQEEIASRLGDRVSLRESHTLSTEELMARVEALRDARLDDHEDDELDDRSPELEAAAAELMARHWQTWFDEPVPALANETPRQAAQSPLGRERLEALLAGYEYHDRGRPAHMRADVAALRRELGI